MKSRRPVHVRQDRNHMATTFELLVSCEEKEAARADRVLSEAHAVIARLEDELTEFREQSPVYRLNQARPGVEVRMPETALELLERARSIRDATNGRFDFAAKSRGAASGERIGWNRSEQLAWRLDPGAHLSFGAIGKGYALDQARALVERAGFHDYLLSGGGSSLILSGFAAPGEPWSWAWSWSKDELGEDLGVPFVHHSGATVALGISGLHEKGAHLLDPRTGSALESTESPLSALVTAPSAADADALSTALFVSGGRGSEDWKDTLAVAPGLALIGPDRVPRWNGIFHRLWKVPESWLGMLSVFALGASCALAALPQVARADDAVDLSELGLDTFTPYIVDRNRWWALLPALAIALVLLHLKKYRPAPRKKPERSPP